MKTFLYSIISCLSALTLMVLINQGVFPIIHLNPFLCIALMILDIAIYFLLSAFSLYNEEGVYLCTQYSLILWVYIITSAGANPSYLFNHFISKASITLMSIAFILFLIYDLKDYIKSAYCGSSFNHQKWVNIRHDGVSIYGVGRSCSISDIEAKDVEGVIVSDDKRDNIINKLMTFPNLSMVVLLNSVDVKSLYSIFDMFCTKLNLSVISFAMAWQGEESVFQKEFNDILEKNADNCTTYIKVRGILYENPNIEKFNQSVKRNRDFNPDVLTKFFCKDVAGIVTSYLFSPQFASFLFSPEKKRDVPETSFFKPLPINNIVSSFR